MGQRDVEPAEFKANSAFTATHVLLVPSCLLAMSLMLCSRQEGTRLCVQTPAARYVHALCSRDGQSPVTGACT